MNWTSTGADLAIIFMLMGVSRLVDGICDGYVLAVGKLVHRANGMASARPVGGVRQRL